MYYPILHEIYLFEKLADVTLFQVDIIIIIFLVSKQSSQLQAKNKTSFSGYFYKDHSKCNFRNYVKKLSYRNESHGCFSKKHVSFLLLHNKLPHLRVAAKLDSVCLTHMGAAALIRGGHSLVCLSGLWKRDLWYFLHSILQLVSNVAPLFCFLATMNWPPCPSKA